ncbi:exodeoxyribonuclease V subunit alpha [Mycobacterium sp. CBMA293]|uniref:exodeoxyribonuclease V subunit alpha n=3 Tax=Mycolicibacterium TaxID=1866885 RepID=UPI0012DF8C35|nr:exodeoxyribonuclease V subunit alpha [Mycolicibacterium sp. CBMA 360]MUL60038.1 exodeoxyribonuclease V subunit alpha [Mycolicibacterium sp. CBMA 335]MUL68881.1 exodeoxyribonuclease V subunit alpha [Mycolicibacterium sp. CBMA 311]MUL93728.1 exodeoxyribonuclease V subunit alpha [Mycolicibacterium sp. CBMA 230]MUM05971.1 exodeoxyribonuclease V subunit alpha [Mycolicibacterium sp. CBMA 213]MUM13012.1 exodeoxyribonuclease V subunit alpha [Mycolicibacterium sp. CBMA 293]
MTATQETTPDPMDWRQVSAASGLLAAFNAAGVVNAADVHVAQRCCALAGEASDAVALAVALTVRALREGSVCVDLTSVASDVGGDLPWPAADELIAAVAGSPLNGTAIRLDHGRLMYLDRYWREEQQVCDDLLALSGRGSAVVTDPDLERLFPPPGFAEQRAAAQLALTQPVTVLTGGPGTGKTTTVARLLALLAQAAHPGQLRIALAAPTGKAAARLQEAVTAEVAKLEPADQERLRGLRAVTLHRLLGGRPDSSSRFRHHRSNRLPHDVIVVDETSMVSLTLMARLLEAVRPEARLLLVGDPDQLTSVQAGAVLADLVDGLAGHPSIQIAALHTTHRFGAAIGGLAEAIRSGDADQVLDLLRAGDPAVEFVEDADPAIALRPMLVGHAVRVRECALLGAGDLGLATMDEHRLLCAHRDGPHGVRYWNRQVERWISEETGQATWSPWYPGRPLLVTANDYALGIYNGDTGLVAAGPDGVQVSIAGATGTQQFSPSRIVDVETMYALTIHKSQGSQAAEVTVILPPAESRLLTRELFYTAVTRAKEKVRIVGSADEVRAAVERQAVRASGLRERLRQSS